MADAESPVPVTSKQLILQAAKKVFVVGILAAAFTYFVDYEILRFRIVTNRSPFATVTVHPLLAVPHKDHRVEFMPDDPQDQTCVNALFPHLGDSPCWYLVRHTRPQVNM